MCIRSSMNSTKFFELKTSLSGLGLNFLGIFETWLKSDLPISAINVPGYKFVRNDCWYSRGGDVDIHSETKFGV